MRQTLMTLTALAFKIVLRRNCKVIVFSSPTTRSGFVGAEENPKALGKGKDNPRVALVRFEVEAVFQAQQRLLTDLAQPYPSKELSCP